MGDPLHKTGDYGELLIGDSIESLKRLEIDRIDIFINDSDHSAEYERQEYEVVNDKLAENALILGDNSHCTNELFKFAKKTNRKFLYFQESTKDHWYKGAGLGVAFPEE